MAAQGPNSPSTVVSSSIAGGTTAWTNPGNATASDDSRATVNVTGAGTARSLLATGFGFSIPSGATIDKIKLEIEASHDGLNTAGLPKFSTWVYYNGEQVGGGTTDTSSLTGSDVYYEDAEPDLWDVATFGSSISAFTPAIINDSTFGVVVKATKGAGGNAAWRADHIRVTVNYTSGGVDLTATSVATSSPALGTPALGQKHVLTATNVAASSPALGTPALAQLHALLVVALAAGSPALGTPVLGQGHPLTATALATSSPALGSPAIGQVHAIGSTSAATSSPGIGSPALGQKHGLTATDAAASSPVLGTPAVGQVQALSATNVATSGPALGNPVMGRIINATATDLATGSPALGSPAIGQIHAITASALAAASPALGAPELGQVHILVPTGVTTSAPVLANPPFVGVSGLFASSAALGSPIFGTPALGQVHALTSTGVTTSGAAIGAPALGMSHLFTVKTTAAVTKAPASLVNVSWVGTVGWVNPGNALTSDNSYATTTFAGGATSQELRATFAFTASDVGDPVAGVVVGIEAKQTGIAGEFSEVTLFAGNAGTGADHIGTDQSGTASALVGASDAVISFGDSASLWDAALTQALVTGPHFGVSIRTSGVATTVSVDQITMTIFSDRGAGVLTGSPVLGTPALGQKHVLTATSIATAAPVLGQPALAQKHVLTTVGVITGSPDIGEPRLRILHLTPPERITVALAQDRTSVALPQDRRTVAVAQNRATTAVDE